MKKAHSVLCTLSVTSQQGEGFHQFVCGFDLTLPLSDNFDVLI